MAVSRILKRSGSAIAEPVGMVLCESYMNGLALAAGA